MRAPIRVVVAFATLTLACTAHVLARQPLTRAATYMYVQDADQIDRFPFVNGRPVSTPDLTIPKETSPIAIGPDGSVYGLSHECVFCQAYITQYDSNGLELRRIVLPAAYGYGSAVNSLLTDAAGRLYVGYTFQYSSKGRRLVESRPATGSFPYPFSGLYVYGTHAKNQDKPMIAFGFQNDCCGPLGMAFDTTGRLLYATMMDETSTGSYRVVANVLHRPREIYTEFGHYIPGQPAFENPGGIEIDQNGIFALSQGFCCSGIASFVSVWTPSNMGTPTGRRPPLARETFPAFPILGYYMALHRGKMFLPTWTSNSVAVFDEFGNGTPLYTIPVEGTATDVKVGP